MATPFKIVVLADFAPGRPAEPPLVLDSGGVDGLMASLSPGLKLGDPLIDAVFKRLEDFTPPELTKGRKELEQDPDQLTKVLHHPLFQSMESAWRGLDFLARRLPEEGVILEILNTPADDIRQRFYDHVFLPHYNGETKHPLGQVLLDFDFDHKPSSLEVLKDLAKMGESLQAPLACQTTASFFGVGHLLHLAALSGLDQRLQGPEYTSFLGFREHPEATWLSLLLNRFLLRLPHQFPSYTEPASADKPDTYLWGKAVWVLGANLARAWGKHAEPAGISGMGEDGQQTGLPTRELPLSRKEKVETPLEAVLPQPIVEMLPYFGLSPLTQLPMELGTQQPGMVYIHVAVNLRRFTDPTARQPGLLTVYTTLAYSIILGRASALAQAALPKLSGTEPQEAADRLSDILKDELGPMAQGELEVSPVEGALHVRLVPKLLIHSKQLQIEFDLPFNG